MREASHRYVIALGSNRRHHRHGRPDEVLQAAIGALGDIGSVEETSTIVATAPIGPSARRFANAAVILSTPLWPDELLHAVRAIETAFGRKRWRRWGERVLDLDIILWSGGILVTPDLIVPHPAFRERRFVLTPVRQIAPDWRDPVTGYTIGQLHHRLSRIGD